mmetsp:Transcript_26169/g.61479  ORF Transcript_26169/g.61479 Transcript_26169/m.61479 type:complete len:335 (+) Transcript_26169:158-1162(+)|eukprot:CAMPEP_0197184830 /NCGR_PEP_ID=MMETSP1423-20130617/10674_1 /TAXON_ID=476441 /ORGANISM="Pseudo-nitzschia heimii, Strain UNC1101" /LENGTH=334 /DNA_ID=CAMNT_0042635747 /DNA_START=92 /DNA_END=1096 /DNA_ORIENTATION=+
MPPNVLQSWDLSASDRHLYATPIRNNDIIDTASRHAGSEDKVFIAPRDTSKASPSSVDYGRILWKRILRNNANNTTIVCNVEEIASKLLMSLYSIRILDDEVKEREWLELFGGELLDISSELLESLRDNAPELNIMATVADFNDNLNYHMQQERGLQHLDCLKTDNIKELEDAIQANEYLGSFLTTKSSLPQPPHVDYPWEVLKTHEETKSLKIGFFPLTEEGVFLQIWPTADPSQDTSIEIEGEIIFIPYGKLLTVPANTIHGGGFRTTELCSNINGDRRGNLRFHLYIATSEASLPRHQTNKYTEPCDKTKELSRRYVDSKSMEILLESFFV